MTPTPSCIPSCTARRQEHSPQLRREAVYLARLGWGGARKIAGTLARRHGVDLSQYTVQDWVRGVRADLDPLAGLPAA